MNANQVDMEADPDDEIATTEFTKSQLLQKGNVLLLKDIPAGTIIHNIALYPTGKMILCRSAGTHAQVINTSQTGFAQVKLQSGEVRLIPVECPATIGMVSNPHHQHTSLGKAGASRWRGIRPSVRGIAMNPVDHPHGGGRKSKGNKAPRSPWGWKTKGFKTVKRKKWYVVLTRQQAKLKSKR